MQAHLFISGYVQGVGYRQFVRKQAEKLGLTGWVKNCDDGSVESVVQGETQHIEQLISLCRKGPMVSDVKDVQIIWDDAAEHYNNFTILHE